MSRLRSAAKIELYRELVPMAEAAAVAYHIILEKPERLRDRFELEEVRGLVAIALSSVGTILKHEDGGVAPLAPQEAQQRLFVRNGQPQQLDGLYMRRIELLRAVEALRQAHIAFDRKHVLEAIRKLS